MSSCRSRLRKFWPKRSCEPREAKMILLFEREMFNSLFKFIYKSTIVELNFKK